MNHTWKLFVLAKVIINELIATMPNNIMMQNQPKIIVLNTGPVMPMKFSSSLYSDFLKAAISADQMKVATSSVICHLKFLVQCRSHEV